MSHKAEEQEEEKEARTPVRSTSGPGTRISLTPIYQIRIDGRKRLGSIFQLSDAYKDVERAAPEAHELVGALRPP